MSFLRTKYNMLVEFRKIHVSFYLIHHLNVKISYFGFSKLFPQRCRTSTCIHYSIFNAQCQQSTSWFLNRATFSARSPADTFYFLSGQESVIRVMYPAIHGYIRLKTRDLQRIRIPHQSSIAKPTSAYGKTQTSNVLCHLSRPGAYLWRPRQSHIVIQPVLVVCLLWPLSFSPFM